MEEIERWCRTSTAHSAARLLARKIGAAGEDFMDRHKLF
jgi:hypothetical protein